MEKGKIIVAESSYIIFEGLKNIVSEIAEFEIILKNTTWNNLVLSVNKNKPDYLIFNFNVLPNDEKINLQSAFKTGNKTKFIVLYPKNLPDFIISQTVLQIKLNEDKNELKSKLRQILASTENKKKTTSVLSKRENMVVRCVALGMTNKEIADHLFLSTHTVITHRKNITKKLGIKTVSGITVYAILNKLVKFDEIEKS